MPLREAAGPRLAMQGFIDSFTRQPRHTVTRLQDRITRRVFKSDDTLPAASPESAVHTLGQTNGLPDTPAGTGRKDSRKETRP